MKVQITVELDLDNKLDCETLDILTETLSHTNSNEEETEDVKRVPNYHTADCPVVEEVDVTWETILELLGGWENPFDKPTKIVEEEPEEEFVVMTLGELEELIAGGTECQLTSE